MSREEIQVTKRESKGKANRKLRRDGFVPANIHGPKTDSVDVQIPHVDMVRAYRLSGESDLVDVSVEGEKKPRPSLISNVQRDPVSGEFIHVDFYQVDLTEKVDVSVEIEFVGESVAVRDHLGLLLTVLDELPIKVLPTEIPSSIEVDISGLNDVGDSVTLADVNLPDGVELTVENLEEVVVKIEAERIEVEEEPEDEGENGEEGEEGEESAGEEGGEAEADE